MNSESEVICKQTENENSLFERLALEVQNDLLNDNCVSFDRTHHRHNR